MNRIDTHISTFVNGDFGNVGYVAPEYVRTLVTTMRGDVYSFGVELLELVTTQTPVDVLVDRDFKGSLVDWVGMLSSSGAMADALDSTLGGKGADEEMLPMLTIGIVFFEWCGGLCDSRCWSSGGSGIGACGML
ncbi:hypothetical protein KC19_VG023600 [Ceratodon purpureus]|uniref:Serine-threonine/tyrosine-protein kinase catalytic domain-containing protein n=1 Tax=Ceratodon purpureus TaxID=3225 RepID=A0A8T0HL81_CERPU|nr:hypothetical protein KC19_VG023600 [Ceratodon purpureus]